MYFQREPTYLKKIVHHVFRMWFDGKINAAVDSVFPFEDFAEAFHRMEDHSDIGKIILDPTLKPHSEQALEAKAKIFERCHECGPVEKPKPEKSETEEVSLEALPKWLLSIRH